MKILITGIHGFVGFNLVEALKKDYTIYGLDIISPQKEGIRYTFSWDYLCEDGGIPDVDAIIHLAGKAHDTKNKSAAEVYFKVNTGLTQKIFDYFLKSSTRKFIFFSTAKAAADRVEGVLTEKVVPAPVGPYGESKIKAEEYVLQRCREMGIEVSDSWLPSAEGVSESTAGASSKVADKQVYILRPCMIHGPGNKGNLNLLYGVVSRGIPWPLGAFDNRRTFTSIENLCMVIEGMLTRPVPSGIYNMGDDETLSTNELITAICSALGKKAHIWRLPKGLMLFTARLSGWLHLPLNPERLRKLTENYISSNAKIKSALSLDHMPVTAREGLKTTLESFK